MATETLRLRGTAGTTQKTLNCFDTLMTQMYTDDTDEKAELLFGCFFDYGTA
jgi:hypothetical protein